MRILQIQTENIGGLQDCDITFPDSEVLALAGANGTGKSKLLACMLSPWTGNIPLPHDLSQKRSVTVTIEFNHDDMEALRDFSRQAGWGDFVPPSSASYTTVVQPIGALNREISPSAPALQTCFNDQNFLRAHPSFNLIFLPAERRLISNRAAPVDLAQLAVEVALQKTSDDRANAFSGRLDDSEFESYAKALCVSGSLPSESADEVNEGLSRWESFKAAVDLLLFPKFLKPLTRENPDQLRIGLPEGGFHAVDDLSSGERQALIVISRVFRAGEGHSIIAIDEPDAYLHPTLSTKLLAALRIGLSKGGRLILATHSPSILDSMPPQAIFRLSHDMPPAVVESEGGRIDLYREAGFRASALTQASLLIATEGEFDEEILPKLLPSLGGANIRGRGGRSQVLRALESLSGYDVPIVGVVDADVMAPTPSVHVAQRCFIWPAADIEGVLLSDQEFISSAVHGALVSPPYRSLPAVNQILEQLLLEYKEQAIAEMAQRILRSDNPFSWPSPRGSGSIMRLRQAADSSPRLKLDDIDRAIARAEEFWTNPHVTKWNMVRGKWILGAFVSKATDFKRGSAFLEAVATRKPDVKALRDFESLALKIQAGGN